MKSVVVLLVILGFTCGDVLFMKIHNDKKELPKDREIAAEEGWNLVNKDEELNIDWYSDQSDPVQLAFDELKGLAGARLVIPKKGENEFYTESKIFEEKTISGKKFYIATVLLIDPKILKKNGRRTNEGDEIVELVLVKKKNGQYERMQRNACDNAKQNIFLEQKCQKNYGLVFAPLKKKDENCDYPFFLVYNEEQKGEMLGFGWFVPATDTKDSKALTEKEIKELFLSTPACLNGKTTINIWLAKDAIVEEMCNVTEGKFVEQRCQTTRRVGMGGDF